MCGLQGLPVDVSVDVAVEGSQPAVLLLHLRVQDMRIIFAFGMGLRRRASQP